MIAKFWNNYFTEKSQLVNFTHVKPELRFKDCFMDTLKNTAISVEDREKLASDKSG